MDNMDIVVNGENQRVGRATSLTAFLEAAGLNPNRVAVERNREIVPRSMYAATALAPGDRLEIVQFVGGG